MDVRSRLGSGRDIWFEKGCGLCKAETLDVLHELLEAFVAPGPARPGVDFVQMSQHLEVLLSQ